MIGLLGAAYEWVKAAHIIFVIFWMAGLFMMPRYLVYHQEALVAGDATMPPRWVEREGKLRSIILTPAMIAVWVLGLLLAASLGCSRACRGWAGPCQAVLRAAAQRLSWLDGRLCQEAGAG